MSEEKKVREQSEGLGLYSPEEVIIKLKKLIKEIERIQANFHKEVTHAQMRIIFPILRDGKGYTIQELADIGGVSKGLVSRTIADLESKGIIQRDKISKDQDRNYNIIISKKGHEFASKKRTQMQKVSNKWNGRITHEDMRTFMKVLNVLTELPKKDS